MEKKRMLYFSHVPWGWIKQRPQFLAEKLSQHMDVDVAERKSLIPGRKGVRYNELSSKVQFKQYYGIPFYDPLTHPTIYILNWLNELLMRLAFKMSFYDYIWVTSVVSYYKIKHLIPSHCKVIFDCMDDELEFPSTQENAKLCKIYKTYESELLKRADYVFCSSEHLKQVLLKRNGLEKDIYVLNNASEFPSSQQEIQGCRDIYKFKRETTSIVYIGTIAEWFDFDSLIFLLENRDDIDVYLVGPQRGNIPTHDKIHWLGTCQHSEIWGIMKQADILVMPFVLNPLIESVNPVKLYEYIWAGKPVIATRYKESEKFEEYVYLYSSKEEMLSVYDHIIDAKKKSKISYGVNHAFVESNTWNGRVREILSVIN